MDLCDLGEVRALLRRHGFQTQKDYGQNFLINGDVPRNIAKSAGVSGRGVIEIGPGIGCLTRELSREAEKTVAVEIDRKLEPILNETLSDAPNTKVIYGDIMKLDLRGLIEREFPDMEVSVCANLPYYITTPIIMRLIEERLPLKTITVMVQREVARRLCADENSKDNGAISLTVRYFTEPEYLFDVPARDFFPAPSVDSAVIRMTVLDTPRVSVRNEAHMFGLIKAAFSQRRKTLANALSNMTGLDKNELYGYLLSIGKNKDIRGERMSLEDFAKLSDILTK
ncbi:MAG: 16S rRNA (adenine(1518)-N(6)/adenine(1519)-N(6))-dimethyltransferase RsmA [Clostridia bacterium]|nr:16S rRNA (adenine(1518)-N(6)/adenine(1519)-N(6))-dimethyltransferase RsmA [Clostridia bacterium]